MVQRRCSVTWLTLFKVDAVLHVVRCFDDDSITHVETTVDPVRDVDIIQAELILSDLHLCEKKLQRKAKVSPEERQFADRAAQHLSKIAPLSMLGMTETEERICKLMGLLSYKPAVYAANVDMDDLVGGSEYVDALIQAVGKDRVSIVSASFEAQLAAVDGEERAAFLADVPGAEDNNCQALIQTIFRKLGLISFFTAGNMESRSWPVRKGSVAPEAGAAIHSDFQTKFIKAEVEDILAHGSASKAKQAGCTRIAGKTTEIFDGDVLLFHHG